VALAVFIREQADEAGKAGHCVTIAHFWAVIANGPSFVAALFGHPTQLASSLR
jgi:hypothetical protein